MYKGSVIEELLAMVARAEEHARDSRFDSFLAPETEMFLPRFGYDLQAEHAEMAGVA